MRIHKYYDSDGSIQAFGTKLDGKRPGYAQWHQRIRTSLEFKQALRCGPYAFPGGYEAVFIMSDGALLCHKCTLRHAADCIASLRGNVDDGWRPIGTMLECETDERIDCENCNRVVSEGADCE